MRYWLLLISILFMLGCSSAGVKKGIESDASHIIMLCDYVNEKENKEITLSSLIKRLEYIPLETPKNLPVDIVLSVKKTNKYIFVLDREQRLFRFDKDGKFLNLIGNKGEGPKEYLGAVNFEIDGKKEIVYLFDIYRRVVHEYSMSGDYIGNHKVPDGITNVALKDDSCFIGYKPWYMSGDNIDRLILLDKNQDSLDIFTLSKFEKKENVKIDIFRMAEFYNTSGKCYIGIPFDNIIYSISEDNNVRKEIYIEQGKYALPKDIALNTDLYNKNLDSSYIFELNAKCMDNWVCMSFFMVKNIIV